MVTENILKDVEQQKNFMIQTRRTLHEYPETALEEEKTRDFLCKILEEEGISYKICDPTGIVAKIGDGEPVIGIRADMDGLLVKELTNLSYASKREGYMHACGHDVHTAALICAAKIIKKYEKNITGTIKFVFQPAEENGKGANLMINSGLIDDVEAMYGLHVFPDIELGKISLEAGPRMARTDKIAIKIEGKGGHAAKPHQCVDAVLMASSIVVNLQSIISRNINPVEQGLLTIGSIHAGTQYNVIAQNARLEGTVRTFSDETADFILKRIEEVAGGTAQTFGGTASLEAAQKTHPPLITDETLTQNAKEYVGKIVGETAFIHVDSMMLGEDYANYQNKMKVVFAFVGGCKKGQKIYPNHNPSFYIEDEAVTECCKVYLGYAMQLFSDRKTELFEADEKMMNNKR